MSIWTWLKPLGVTNGSSLRESSTGGRISAVPSYLKSIARGESGEACAVVNGWGRGFRFGTFRVSEAALMDFGDAGRGADVLPLLLSHHLEVLYLMAHEFQISS